MTAEGERPPVRTPIRLTGVRARSEVRKSCGSLAAADRDEPYVVALLQVRVEGEPPAVGRPRGSIVFALLREERSNRAGRGALRIKVKDAQVEVDGHADASPGERDEPQCLPAGVPGRQEGACGTGRCHIGRFPSGHRNEAHRRARMVNTEGEATVGERRDREHVTGRCAPAVRPGLRRVARARRQRANRRFPLPPDGARGPWETTPRGGPIRAGGRRRACASRPSRSP